MCLDRLDTEPSLTKGEGYKILRTSYSGRLFTGLIQGERQALTEGQWTTDKGQRNILCLLGSTTQYPSGFHIFRTLKGVEQFHKCYGWKKHPVRRVRFSQVVATGFQDRVRVIVAKRIKLLPKATN